MEKILESHGILKASKSTNPVNAEAAKMRRQNGYIRMGIFA